MMSSMLSAFEENVRSINEKKRKNDITISTVAQPQQQGRCHNSCRKSVCRSGEGHSVVPCSRQDLQGVVSDTTTTTTTTTIKEEKDDVPKVLSRSSLGLTGRKRLLNKESVSIHNNTTTTSKRRRKRSSSGNKKKKRKKRRKIDLLRPVSLHIHSNNNSTRDGCEIGQTSDEEDTDFEEEKVDRFVHRFPNPSTQNQHGLHSFDCSDKDDESMHLTSQTSSPDHSYSTESIGDENYDTSWIIDELLLLPGDNNNNDYSVLNVQMEGKLDRKRRLSEPVTKSNQRDNNNRLSTLSEGPYSPDPLGVGHTAKSCTLLRGVSNNDDENQNKHRKLASTNVERISNLSDDDNDNTANDINDDDDDNDDDEKEEELFARAQDYIPPYDSKWWLYLMSIMPPEDEEEQEQEEISEASTNGVNININNDDQANQKTLTHIGKSRQPLRCVHLHNKKKVHSKLTHGAAGLWSIELVIGPFDTKRETFPLRDLWKSKTRGPVTRREFGKWLAAQIGCKCYDAKHGMEEFYADMWKESRMERRRVRFASKAAAHNTAYLRRQKPKPILF